MHHGAARRRAAILRNAISSLPLARARAAHIAPLWSKGRRHVEPAARGPANIVAFTRVSFQKLAARGKRLKGVEHAPRLPPREHGIGAERRAHRNHAPPPPALHTFLIVYIFRLRQANSRGARATCRSCGMLSLCAFALVLKERAADAGKAQRGCGHNVSLEVAPQRRARGRGQRAQRHPFHHRIRDQEEPRGTRAEARYSGQNALADAKRVAQVLQTRRQV